MIFRPRNENELALLPAEEIVEYAVAARDAGDAAEFERAVQVCIFVLRPRIEAMVSLKITDATDADQVVGEILTDAIRSAATISGSYFGEFFNWVRTITQRRVADFYARPKSGVRQVSIGPGGDEDRSAEVDLAEDDRQYEAVLIEVLIERLLESRSALHIEVIRRRRRGEPSKGIAAVLSEGGSDGEMTPANVDQIFSRFRKDLAGAMKVSDV